MSKRSCQTQRMWAPVKLPLSSLQKSSPGAYSRFHSQNLHCNIFVGVLCIRCKHPNLGCHAGCPAPGSVRRSGSACTAAVVALRSCVMVAAVVAVVAVVVVGRDGRDGHPAGRRPARSRVAHVPRGAAVRVPRVRRLRGRVPRQFRVAERGWHRRPRRLRGRRMRAPHAGVVVLRPGTGVHAAKRQPRRRRPLLRHRLRRPHHARWEVAVPGELLVDHAAAKRRHGRAGHGQLARDAARV
jgi:hypothetical protein